MNPATAKSGDFSALLNQNTPGSIRTVTQAATDMRDLDGRYEFLVNIDRSLAALLIGVRDGKQRRITGSRVQEIREDIDAGRWLNTGDPLRLSPSGTLVDGQHRLTAYLGSKSPSFILRDAIVVVLKTKEALDVVDIGKSRTVTDLRKMTGRAALPVRAISGILYEHRDFMSNKTLSKAQRNLIIDKHPFLTEIQELSQYRGVNIFVSPVIAAAIRCMKVPKARGEAFKFFNSVLQNRHTIDGVPCPQIETLATWLIHHSHGGGGSHSMRKEVVSRCIYAWNAYREGRPLLQTRYSPKNEIPEPC